MGGGTASLAVYLAEEIINRGLTGHENTLS